MTASILRDLNSHPPPLERPEAFSCVLQTWIYVCSFLRATLLYFFFFGVIDGIHHRLGRSGYGLKDVQRSLQKIDSFPQPLSELRSYCSSAETKITQMQSYSSEGSLCIIYAVWTNLNLFYITYHQPQYGQPGSHLSCADVSTKCVMSRSRYVFVSWRSHQEVEADGGWVTGERTAKPVTAVQDCVLTFSECENAG